ncbi:hypothetical protein HMPREF1982_00313 [Clostridiales bacterium oral taxon 876 str. F0540]|nr:hypothetical protein HMPREF1982_00313 [Clostridiales bacterium oral taxon 876 str. F0540]
MDFLEQNMQTPKSSDTAALASRLNLISSILNNFNFSKQDEIFVVAGIIGLLSTYLVRKAAVQEANEQQIAPGVTTFANNLKLIGTSIGLISSSILFWALLIEVSLRAQGIQAPQSSAVGIARGAGAVLVQ